MTELELAQILAEYLTDRDDIATAEVLDDVGPSAPILVTTQGGAHFTVTVAAG